ncbi:Predicted dehydrogenase [Natronorubrum texcoconense]|uniref:Predicted dehydrogenase n=2 Tax=Natronorubrum texcoconense TaxID=1095776 RepID=A0A1G9CR42_9EURY|nr:Gfo/Idh/MocA family oxidoreductase [Natronorubrum texcoconense]SDK53904.1 Predicted dehydrogenase [Natronorubrum texcoconense]
MYDVAIVGTGPDPSNPTLDGFAMGYRHAEAYRNHDDCRLVACADIVPENGAAFADEFEIAAEYVFEDYRELLAAVEPDVVSVAVPPAIHEEIVVGCARSVVDAIHCEKPLAHTWASAQRTVQTCWRADVQLTFNRQRRFGRPFVDAKQLLEDGAIGDLERIEIGWGDFYDTGAHTVDLAGMFAGDRSAKWVIAQLDYREEDRRFGSHQENQMWAQWRYDDGVHAVLSTGAGKELVGAAILLRGTDGEIRIAVDDGPMLEVRSGGSTERIDVGGETMHRTGNEGDRFGSEFHDRAVEHVLDCLEEGTEPELSGRIGLNTAEILFGGYESVRRRGRVDLPLEIDDNPLEAMVASGDLSPEPAADEIGEGGA